MRIRIVVASNRAAAGVYPDASGPVLADGFRDAGFEVDQTVVVPDGEAVGHALRRAVDDGVDAVITSGGTGLTATDLTPEITASVVEREIPGIAERIRSVGAAATPFAALSRGIAGVCGRTLIVNLAGSTGAARDGLTVLIPLLPHVIDQINDGDHPREDP